MNNNATEDPTSLFTVKDASNSHFDVRIMVCTEMQISIPVIGISYQDGVSLLQMMDATEHLEVSISSEGEGGVRRKGS